MPNIMQYNPPMPTRSQDMINTSSILYHQGNTTTEEPAVKKAKPSWDTGVGKLSSKSALSSLVRVKKPNSDGGLRKNVATGSDKNVQRPLPETSSISINGEKKEAEKHTDNSGKQPGGSSLALLGDYSSSEGDSD